MEGRDLATDRADVIVSDGFTGNVFLKTTEGAAQTMAMLMLEAPHDGAQAFTGSGISIGGEPFTGRACVSSDPADALARLAPGDVLVTTHTTPSYEAVLPIAGALVTEHGGLTSHAALVARELGLPAVLGVTAATTTIPDGATVTVDPRTGTVTIVA